MQVQLGEIDLMALDVKGTVTAHLDAVVSAAEDGVDEDEEVLSAGPLTIAVDLNDSTQTEGT